MFSHLRSLSYKYFCREIALFFGLLPLLGCVEKLSYTDIYPSTEDILRNSVSLVLFLILIKIEARYIKAR